MKNINLDWMSANWRTTAMGAGAALMALLTMLAAAPYELGEVATLISPEWKTRVFVTGAIATVILRVLSSVLQRDANVTSVDSGLQDVEPAATAEEVITPIDS